MLTCRDITGLVTDYLEERMSLPDRMTFRLHLRMCDVCERYVEQMEQTRARTGELPTEPIPEDVKAALMAQFRDWKKDRGGRG